MQVPENVATVTMVTESETTQEDLYMPNYIYMYVWFGKLPKSSVYGAATEKKTLFAWCYFLQKASDSHTDVSTWFLSRRPGLPSYNITQKT